ncbi:uncharacterized protein C8Q71DRAFT_797926 [Rhodofomes roseus]|uniref:Uncharacterized protein n=1 Tax=Rhodofomes roseus TaxID=34475 RepID=A0ABQ8K9W8_9APHY|nr:uncharacterized protein C8Q71DRAFT_797926 [Rhodofomes roseus]KAH9834118.1 hypothetical protein C8Q71DRAFT_797926 [Rhodofomes roseus]
MTRHAHRILLCLLLAGCVWAQETPPDYTVYADPGYPRDPILELRPPFPRSLPVQVVLNGIVLTLSSVLLIQLLFTAQYHWPMAPVNFVLQLSGVLTLLVCSIVTTHIVFSAVDSQSQTWPYMLNYLAVDIPPSPPVFVSWPTADLAAWSLMTATCSALIQITHIQFLTLLFPSKLEKRLIYILLAPLAVTSAIMQLLRVIARSKLLESVAAVQNICNATLSLLFTAALFIWGFLVNRQNAWRMDGGTAAFGVGALTLAPMSTAIAFVYVPTKEQYTWMPQLMWAIILWQSFLGWWWWVGAGMGVGAVDELLCREEKRKQKRALRNTRRRQQRERAETVLRGVTGALGLRRAGSEERPILGSTNTATTSSGTFHSSAAGHTSSRPLYEWFLYWRREHLQATRAQAVERVERSRRDRARDDATIVASESDEDAEFTGSPTKAANNSKLGGASGVEVVSEEAAPHIRHEAREEDAYTVARPLSKAEDARTVAEQPPSIWWLGPLRRWRLQDLTVY